MLPLLLCRFAQTSAAVLLAGTAALRLLARGTGIERLHIWDRLAWGTWSVLLVAGVLQLGLTAAAMSGLPFAQACCSGEVLGNVLSGTSFGAVWKVRASLLASLLVVGCFLSVTQRRDDRPGLSTALEITGALLSVSLLANLVWSGHARASDQHAWLLPVNVLHVIAAGAWPGGLLPLAVLLAHARRDRKLLSVAVTVTRRFSHMSVAAVGILSLSGSLTGIGLVGTLPALWLSAYGRWLLCKVALLAGMVSLGAMNRRLIWEAPFDDPAQAMRRLWYNVAWECALAVCVLLATEALAMSAPPTSAG